MNKVLLHQKINISKLLLISFSSIMILIIYGCFKNGILLYQKGLISFFMIFRPIYFVLIPLAISIFIKYLKTKRIRIDFDDYYWATIGLFMPPQMSLLTYLILLLILIPLLNKIPSKFNKNVLAKLLIILFLIIFSHYTYYNLLEETTIYSFSFLDLFFGRAIGGISSTSFLGILICYFIFALSHYYKTEIPFLSFLTYLAFNFLTYLMNGNFSSLYLGSATIMLAFVIYGSCPNYSPFMPKSRVIYSFCLGLFTFIFAKLINVYEGVFLALLLCSFLSPYFDKFIYALKNK